MPGGSATSPRIRASIAGAGCYVAISPGDWAWVEATRSVSSSIGEVCGQLTRSRVKTGITRVVWFG